MKKNIFFAFLFLVQAVNLFAWEPLSQNYTNKEFKAHPLIWSFTQDAMGRLWMANNEGVLRFEGNKWTLFPTPKPVRSLSFDKAGNLFLACEGDLASFIFDEKGKPAYMSFKERLGVPKGKIIGDKKVLSVGEDIFFTSGKFLFKVEQKDKTFDIKINSLTEISGAFVWNGKLLINELNKGLGVWNKNKVYRLKGGDLLKGKTIIGEAPFENGLILGTNYDGLYLFDGNEVYPYKGVMNSFAAKGLAGIVSTQKGKIALGTFYNGVQIYDAHKLQAQTIKLPSDDIYSLFFDHEENLWIAHRKGLTHVYLNSPIKYFEEFGLSACVNNMKKIGNKLFLATTNGLYETNINNPKELIPVKNLNGECWDLSSNYVATTSGLFGLDGKNYIPNETFLYLQHDNLNHQNTFAFTANSCYLIHEPKTVQMLTKKMPEIDEMSNSIYANLDGSYWVGTQFNGLLKIPSKGSNKEELPPSLKESGVIIRVKNGKPIFQAKDGVFSYNGRSFMKEEALSSVFMGAKNKQFEFDNDFWIYTDNNLRQIKNDKIVEQSPAYAISGRPTAICEDGEKIWLAFEDKVYLLEPNSVTTYSNKTYIYRITNESGDILYNAGNLSEQIIPQIPYNENFLQIAFGTNSCVNPAKILYRYQLKGLSTIWSNWKNESEISFTKLTPGNYELTIEAKTASGNLSEKSILKFIILSPWYLSIYAYLLYGILIMVLFWVINRINNKVLKTKNHKLEKIVTDRTKELELNNIALKYEKKKSDDLLLNILPGEIAEELKTKGSSEAKLYDHVTVMFTDFVNFTGISEKLSPKELVTEIDECFKAFDAIVENNGLEKIKTIGDAYLAVCGMPIEEANHAIYCANAARDIVSYIQNRKKTGGLFDVRIGLNSGPVVAGIVGSKKFAYDIWGDTVNVASRIESNSEANKINISGSTYELIKQQFICQYRGKIDAKNKGMMDMYFL